MGTMFVWSSPALNYLDPDYCQGQSYHCDLELSKQQAVWVNAIAFLGCIVSVPLAGETSNTFLSWHQGLFHNITPTNSIFCLLVYCYGMIRGQKESNIGALIFHKRL